MARKAASYRAAAKPRQSPKSVKLLKQRQGQRNKLSQRYFSRISVLVKRSRATGTRQTFTTLAKTINETKDGKARIGRTTVWNHMAEAGVSVSASSGNWPSKISFQDLPRWLKERRGFCKVYKSCDKTHMLMADESFFYLKRNDNPNKPKIHPTGSVQAPQYFSQGAGKRVVVWWALGPQYVAPIVIDERGQYWNSDEYAAMLTPKALPYLARLKGKGEFWEDGASWHTSRQTTALYAAWGIEPKRTKGHWKDLNWMEKVWAVMKDMVYKDKKTYQTKAELVAAIRSAARSLGQNQEFRHALVACFEKACKQVLASRGYYTNW